MHIEKILKKRKISFSFEFFPPHNEEAAKQLYRTIGDIVPLGADFVSVTYGAGGSGRELTHDLVLKIQKETKLDVVSHLTCVGSPAEEIEAILNRYNKNGIDNIMALRGDPQKGSNQFIVPKNGFRNATELVSFTKTRFPDMGIGIAGYPEGHPETPNRLLEMDYLKAKVDAGADYICTQMFFNNSDFYDFRDRCRLSGIDLPVLAGIMPITTMKGMQRMAELALGMRYPSKLLKALLRAENDDYVEKVGIHWATEQLLDLIDNDIDGVHFYTLNKSKATREIYSSLGVSNSRGLNK